MSFSQGRSQLGLISRIVLKGEISVQWVRQLIKAGKPGDALDHVVFEFPLEEYRNMLKVLHIVNMCTADDPVKWPRMLEVMKFFRDPEVSPNNSTSTAFSL